MYPAEGKTFPLEAAVQRSIILALFDVTVLAGFGAYLTLTIGLLPDEIRTRLLLSAVRFWISLMCLLWQGVS